MVLISLSFRLFAQEIIYRPVFIDQCKDSISESRFWLISDSNGNYYTLNSFASTSVYLPKLGKYFLHLEIEEEPEIISIEKYGETIDTFYTERVQLVIYVSNPPHSEFLDCGSLANGQVIDFYYNGNIRLTGDFLNGQPIDTLKKFYRSGIIQELYIPNKRHRQKINYYKNGQIQTNYNFAKRYRKDYYESGELKKETSWNRKYQTEKFEYYKNGQIKLKENRKTQIGYFSNGLIKNQTTRKKVLKLEKIFTKYGTPLFEYQCNLFDSVGNKIAFIQYWGDSFNYRNYPDSITQINKNQFGEILLYKNGKAINKVDFKYEKNGGDYVKKLILYEMENDVWIEKDITAANNVFKILASHLKSNAL